MNFPLPSDCPTLADYPAGTAFTDEASQGWEFHRGPGSGGGNAGQDMMCAAGSAVASIDYSILSDHGAGAFDLHAVFPPGDPGGTSRVVPIGFHAGARLEPGSVFGGAGATYKGEVTLKTVPISVFLLAYANKIITGH